MAIVYEHIRNDTNEVFYVGIGEEEGRAYVRYGRNPHWKNIVNKSGYTVNIIHKDIDWEEAKKIEILLIEKYGRKDLVTGNLVNMTDGGEGTLGLIVSEETRQKRSEALKGKKLSDEHRQKMSEVRKSKKLSDEHRQKMMDGLVSEESRHKMSLSQRNKEGVKGYYFYKATKQYKAQISVKGKHIHLGLFDTPEEASEAYQKARLIYFV
jgi:hypothetical protein